MIICILGRQPKLGLAELESRFGNDKVEPVGQGAALVSIEPDQFPHRQIGSVIKAAKFLNVLPTTDWQKLMQYCAEQLPAHLSSLPEGKLKLGLSAYGLKVNLKTLQRSGLELKKTIRGAG